MKDIIIGAGSVGQALEKILKTKYDIDIFDIKNKDIYENEYKVMHICFPYNKNFIKEIKRYLKLFKPKVIIIHSTIKVGTTQKIIKETKLKTIVHSPIRGQHNNLTYSIKLFSKFIGVDNPHYQFENKNLYRFLQKYFEEVNIHTIIYKNSCATELAKMLCLFQYGMHNIVADEAKNICDKFELDYNKVILFWNETYNQGYDTFRLEPKDYHRPLLIPSIKHGWGEHGIYDVNKMLYEQTKNPIIKNILKRGKKNK